jgi:hypothetical protein
MLVFIKLLPPLGYYLDSTFSIIPNVGVAIPNTASKEDLLNGLNVEVNDLAVSIKIKSSGENCISEIIYPIGGIQTTTTSTTTIFVTTTTTTVAPTTTSTTSVAPVTTTSTSTTSTTSTTTLPPCKCYKIQNISSSGSVYGTYNPCDGLGTFLIAPTKYSYLCTRYESSIFYISNGSLAIEQEVLNTDPDYDYCPCSGVIPTTTSTTTIPSTTTSTSTSTTTTTTTLAPFYEWNASSIYTTQEQVIAVGCENFTTYYTATYSDFTEIFLDSDLTNPVPLSGFITINDGTNVFIVEIILGNVSSIIPFGLCDSVHIVISVYETAPIAGVRYLKLRATVTKDVVLDTLNINGQFLTHSTNDCTGSVIGLAPVGFSLIIPASTVTGTFIDTPVLVPSTTPLPRESVYLNNLTVGGDNITSTMQFIDVNSTSYGIFSTFGTCFDITLTP